MNKAIKNRVWVGAGIAMLAGTLWLLISPSDDLEKNMDVIDTGIRRQSTQGDAQTAPRPPLRIRSQSAGDANVAEPENDFEALGDGHMSASARVNELQGMRGRELSGPERERAMEFLSGGDWPEGVAPANIHWISDELLTVLRLQQPPQDDLAARLADVAFQPDTNPVTRDYIMQHLGHLWEQYGAREEIEKALWRATATADELVPGAALIALSRGYARDSADGKLENVRERAFVLARNPSSSLAVRVTALAIAGEGGGREVKAFAATLEKDPATPVILRKVAERIGER